MPLVSRSASRMSSSTYAVTHICMLRRMGAHAFRCCCGTRKQACRMYKIDDESRHTGAHVIVYVYGCGGTSTQVCITALCRYGYGGAFALCVAHLFLSHLFAEVCQDVPQLLCRNDAVPLLVKNLATDTSDLTVKLTPRTHQSARTLNASLTSSSESVPFSRVAIRFSRSCSSTVPEPVESTSLMMSCNSASVGFLPAAAHPCVWTQADGMGDCGAWGQSQGVLVCCSTQNQTHAPNDAAVHIDETKVR